MRDDKLFSLKAVHKASKYIMYTTFPPKAVHISLIRYFVSLKITTVKKIDARQTIFG